MKNWSLILLFVYSSAFALDTPSHTLQGGLLCGSIAKMCGANKTTTWWIFGAGAVLGALPDIVGATGYHAELDWPNYNLSHRWGTVASYIPPITLHLLVDGSFHPRPGENWWPDKWKLALGYWIGELILTYLFIRWVNNDGS